MKRPILPINLYGAEGCHKSHYYKLVLDEIGLPYWFLDVEANKDYANQLRDLYKNKRLNYPTITIGKKKLRNPYKEELILWINKLIPQQLELYHNKKEQKYTMVINDHEAWVAYNIYDGKMFLEHSEVPHHLRGYGIGKELVLKTFEKLTEEGYKAVAVCSYIIAVKNLNLEWKDAIA